MARLQRILLCLAVPVAAISQEPPRPSLVPGTDPKHWEGYFDFGVSQFKQALTNAEAGFYWASRLDPSRAEPLFGRWATAIAHLSIGEVRAYFRGDEGVRRRPEILRADSLRDLALVRNPFVHRGLEILIWERFPGSYADDRDTGAWIAYSNGEFAKAIDLQTRTIEQGGRSAYWRRYDRALAAVAFGDLPRALEDVRALVDELRKQDEQQAVVMYRSKHYLLYMAGLVLVQLQRYPEARAAFAESLLEDASFAYSNVGLATVSRLQRQDPKAADEFVLAIELAPHDGLIRFRYAQVLFDLQRFEGAAEQLVQAMALEPHFAAPVLLLGRLREKQGKTVEATQLYERFIAMAPANDSQAKALRLKLDLRAKRAP